MIQRLYQGCPITDANAVSILYDGAEFVSQDIRNDHVFQPSKSSNIFSMFRGVINNSLKSDKDKFKEVPKSQSNQWKQRNDCFL